jgi:phage anti-repressor protein
MHFIISTHDTLIETVNAREIHAEVDSKQDFSTWIKVRIAQGGFIENEDFTLFHKTVENPQGGRPAVDYHITIDMAKHLGMMERNEKGKEIRQWFIEREKATALPHMTQTEILAGVAQAAAVQERKLLALEEQQRIQASKNDHFETQLRRLEVDTRNGVPLGYIARAMAHRSYGRGLSRKVFEEALTTIGVPTQKYVHSEEGHSTHTFAWREDHIEQAVNLFLDDATQKTGTQWESRMLSGRRFRYVKQTACC